MTFFAQNLSSKITKIEEIDYWNINQLLQSKAEDKEEKGELTLDKLLPPERRLFDMASCLAAAGMDVPKGREIYEDWDIEEVAEWLAVKNGMEYWEEKDDGKVDGQT